MTTSEQRVRARKTRKGEDIPADQGVKSKRGRRDRMTNPETLLRNWICEGQLDLFDPSEGQQS